MSAPLSFRPVAILRTPFGEKFGVPRQSGLVQEATGRVEFLPEFNRADFVRGLDSFSHVWLVTAFHQSPQWDGKATVRPPRLGGNARLGVFATRSPNRPNPIGLSLVRLVAIQTEPSVQLVVSGIDAVDGTPVFDIKPYLPWCEAVADATAGWAGGAPARLAESAVEVPDPIRARILARDDGDAQLRLIVNLLRFALQPAYHEPGEGRSYGMTVAGWNVRWRHDGARAVVFEATRATGEP